MSSEELLVSVSSVRRLQAQANCIKSAEAAVKGRGDLETELRPFARTICSYPALSLYLSVLVLCECMHAGEMVPAEGVECL